MSRVSQQIPEHFHVLDMPRGQRHAVQQLIQLHALTPFPMLSARFYRPAPLAVLSVKRTSMVVPRLTEAPAAVDCS